MSQITTHVLDTSLGRPAGNIPVSLYRRVEEDWLSIGNGVTDDDGRIGDLLPSETKLEAGVYRLVFLTEPYHGEKQTDSFYPHVEIIFRIAGDGQHYHVPLLLNPYGYSTYRGS